MNMNRLFFLLCCSLLINLCAKDNQQSKATSLTAGTWKIIADSINPARNINNNMETDMYQFYDPCDRDDYFRFASDGTYELNNGSQKCQSGDPQTISGTWFFSDGDTKLNLSPYNNYLFGICDMQELKDSRMKLVWYTRDQNGTITRTHVITLTH